MLLMEASHGVAQGHFLYARATLGNYSRVIAIITIARRPLGLLSDYSSYIELNRTFRYLVSY